MLLWAADERLAGSAKTAIELEADEVFVSAATIWEIEITRALGRLRAPDDVGALVDASGFERLAIEFDHAQEAGRLPAHHSDPFDRILVAQAKLEGLTLATADGALARYEIAILEVGPG